MKISSFVVVRLGIELTPEVFSLCPRHRQVAQRQAQAPLAPRVRRSDGAINSEIEPIDGKLAGKATLVYVD